LWKASALPQTIHDEIWLLPDGNENLSGPTDPNISAWLVAGLLRLVYALSKATRTRSNTSPEMEQINNVLE
jgi:hypothetical protein